MPLLPQKVLVTSDFVVHVLTQDTVFSYKYNQNWSYDLIPNVTAISTTNYIPVYRPQKFDPFMQQLSMLDSELVCKINDETVVFYQSHPILTTH